MFRRTREEDEVLVAALAVGVAVVVDMGLQLMHEERQDISVNDGFQVISVEGREIVDVQECNGY